jgi:LacI family transcriptional regulator
MIGDEEERAGADRILGYRDAMIKRGLTAQIQVVPGGFSESDGYRAAQELLRHGTDRVTAIFVASDLAALGALDAAAAAGVSVPGELSVVGYDNTPFAALRHISLSSVDQSAAEIGTVAADVLLQRISDPHRRARRITIAPSLVPRQTSGVAP